MPPAAAESKTVVAGQLTSAGTSLTVLFDSGATHSFISTRLVDQLCRPGSMLDRPMHIILPGGERVVSRRGIRALPLTIDGRELHIDVIELEIDDFDLILGMDVLEKYGANINCKTKTITFAPKGEMPFMFLGTILISRVPRISALKARELLQQGCVGYLAHVVDTNRTETSGPGETRVVCDFADVFPDELPGLPPSREIEFAIDLIPGSEPALKAPYRMAPAELKELKV